MEELSDLFGAAAVLFRHLHLFHMVRYFCPLACFYIQVMVRMPSDLLVLDVACDDCVSREPVGAFDPVENLFGLAPVIFHLLSSVGHLVDACGVVLEGLDELPKAR